MAYYYVRDDGTATGDGGRHAAAKTATDDWATAFSATTEYYGSIFDVFDKSTTKPTSSDFIYVSSAHDYTYTSAHMDWAANSVQDPGLQIYSVDDNNVGQYLAGAKESSGTGSGLDAVFNATDQHLTVYGVNLHYDDDFVSQGSGTQISWYDATFDLDGSGDRALLHSSGDNSYFYFNNVDFVWPSGTAFYAANVQAGGVAEYVNCRFTATTGTLDDLWGGSLAQNGGATIRMFGCDLDDINGYIVGAWGSDVAADDNIDVFLSGCSVAGMAGFVEENFKGRNKTFTAVNCDGTSADAEWQFYQKKGNGEVETVPDNVSGGVVRNSGGSTFNGGRNHSFKITTDSDCNKSNPFFFDIPSKFIDLSNAASDTVRIYFARQTGTLSDTEIWAEVLYPDGTNKNVWNSASNRNSDILASGTTHTDDSGSSDWEDNGVDLTSWNEYRMDVSTTGDAGAACVPIIRIYVAIDTSTDYIYVDGTIDAV